MQRIKRGSKMSRSNAIVNYSETPDGRQVFDVIGAGKLVFDAKKASAENNIRAMKFGWNRPLDSSHRLARPNPQPRSRFVAVSNSSGNPYSTPTACAVASAASTCRACSSRVTSNLGVTFPANVSTRVMGFACRAFTTRRLIQDSSRSTKS